MKQTSEYLAINKKANYNYVITETFEAGIVLKGTEIKSIRLKQINITDSFVQIRNDEAFLYGTNINIFKYGNQFNHDPFRTRKLLLHKKEIKKINKIINQKGKAIIPLKVYLKHGFVKILIGIGTGKNKIDKRETIKIREQNRIVSRSLKDYNRK